eukprot:6185411-Pleurochrysis_carterae.AAC.4
MSDDELSQQHQHSLVKARSRYHSALLLLAVREGFYLKEYLLGDMGWHLAISSLSSPYHMLLSVINVNMGYNITMMSLILCNHQTTDPIKSSPCPAHQGDLAHLLNKYLFICAHLLKDAISAHSHQRDLSRRLQGDVAPEPRAAS